MLTEESQQKIKKYVSFLRHQMLAGGESLEYVFSLGDEAVLATFRKCSGCGDDLFSKALELRTILEFDAPDKVFDVLYDSIEHDIDEDLDDINLDEEDEDEYIILHEALEDDDDDIDLETEIIRAKGIMDGADSLDEAIAYVRAYADLLEHIKNEGYELLDIIEDDYGHVYKENNCEQKES